MRDRLQAPNMKSTTKATPQSRERNFSSDNADRLDTWKEIAGYLNRNVRTVQRWEACESMPVHRQFHVKSGSVHAFISELDTWRQERSYCSPPGCDPRSTQRSEKRLISDKEQAILRTLLETISVQLTAQAMSAMTSVPTLDLELQNRGTTSELEKWAKTSRKNSMATVLSHIHFCPTCHDTWKCVSWVCEQEDGDLTCLPCRVKSRDESEPEERFGTMRDPAEGP